MSNDLIKLQITPTLMFQNMPLDSGIERPEEGFSDKVLVFDGVEFTLSYDGESELICSKWEPLDKETAELVLSDIFIEVEDDIPA